CFKANGRRTRGFTELDTGELIRRRWWLCGVGNGDAVPEDSRPELVTQHLVGEHSGRRQRVAILEQFKVLLEIGAVDVVDIAALNYPVTGSACESLVYDVPLDQLSRLIRSEDGAEKVLEGMARHALEIDAVSIEPLLQSGVQVFGHRIARGKNIWS